MMVLFASGDKGHDRQAQGHGERLFGGNTQHIGNDLFPQNFPEAVTSDWSDN